MLEILNPLFTKAISLICEFKKLEPIRLGSNLLFLLSVGEFVKTLKKPGSVTPTIWSVGRSVKSASPKS